MSPIIKSLFTIALTVVSLSTITIANAAVPIQHGKVTGKNGQPLPFVPVHQSNSESFNDDTGGGNNDRGTRYTSTDINGNYSFDPAQTYNGAWYGGSTACPPNTSCFNNFFGCQNDAQTVNAFPPGASCNAVTYDAKNPLSYQRNDISCSSTNSPVGGYVFDYQTGERISGASVFVTSDGNNGSRVNTGSDGGYSSWNNITAGYAVRMSTVPSGYQLGSTRTAGTSGEVNWSSKIGWTHMPSLKSDTPYGNSSYELQSLGNSDCGGPSGSGNTLRCNFTVSKSCTQESPTTDQFGNTRSHVCYYNFNTTDKSFTENDILTQEYGPTFDNTKNIVTMIDSNWSAGNIGNSKKSDGVAAVWKSSPYFRAGYYTFHAKTDDGVRVSVSGAKKGKNDAYSSNGRIIDSWVNRGATEDVTSPPVYLEAGNHDVSVYYFDNSGSAESKVWWEYEPLRFCTACTPQCPNTNSQCRVASTATCNWGDIDEVYNTCTVQKTVSATCNAIECSGGKSCVNGNCVAGPTPTFTPTPPPAAPSITDIYYGVGCIAGSVSDSTNVLLLRWNGNQNVQSVQLRSTGSGSFTHSISNPVIHHNLACGDPSNYTQNCIYIQPNLFTPAGLSITAGTNYEARLVGNGVAGPAVGFSRPACPTPTPRPPTAPTISPLTCTPTSTYSVNISWGNPAITWVDLGISPNPDASYSHKSVTRATTTSAPTGFGPYVGTGVSQLQAGVTYYARVFDRYQNSSWTSFSRSLCAPPTPSPTPTPKPFIQTSGGDVHSNQ